MSDPTWTPAMLAANFESMRLLYLQAETERNAAVSALALATNSEPGKGTGVWMTLPAYQDLLTQIAEMGERVKAQMVQLASVTAERDALRVQVDRYGADQWRRGNAGKDPQEFDEWRKEQ